MKFWDRLGIKPVENDNKINHHPQKDFILLQKGDALFELEKYKESIECYNKALEVNPENDDVWISKGHSLFELDLFEDSIECYDKALKIDAENDDVWVFKGYSFYFLYQFEEVIRCFDEALKINPKNGGAWTLKGFYFSSIDQLEEAIECYDNALKINSENGWVWGYKGDSLSKLGKYKESIDCYDLALEINPENKQALFNKGFQLGKFEEKQKNREEIENSLLLEKINEMLHIQGNIQKGISELKNDHIKTNSNFDHLFEKVNRLIIDVSNIKEKSSLNTEELVMQIEKKIDESFNKKLTGQKYYETYLLYAKEAIEKWDCLEENTKDYLIISEYLYSSLNELNNSDEVDYSPIVIEICRSVEYEIKQKLFVGFVSYIHSQYKNIRHEFRDSSNTDSELFWRILSNIVDEKGNIINELNITLGQMCKILKIADKQKAKNNYKNKEYEKTKNTKLINEFREYISSQFFLDANFSSIFFENIDSIIDYRNKSAHAHKLNKNVADFIRVNSHSLINNFLALRKSEHSSSDISG